jgi:hypothetical protein
MDAADSVNWWITGFRAVWTACGSVNTIVKQVHWNPFANATTGTYLKSAGAQATFLSALRTQFDLNGLTQTSILQIVTSGDTFNKYTTETLGELWLCVVDMVAGHCPATCFSGSSASNDLVWTTPLQTAFPAGAADANWVGLMNDVKASNLDNLLASKAMTTVGKQVVDPATTLKDLITTLSTI